MRQKAQAHAQGNDRDERPHIGLGQSTQVVESATVQKERRGSDGHDARGQTVKAINQVDGLAHTHEPQDRDQRNPIVAQHEDVQERDSEVEHRGAEVHEHESGNHGARHFGRA